MHRWYDGYRIVVSEVKATNGDQGCPADERSAVPGELAPQRVEVT